MPKNQFERMIFALLTVIVTVHSYVFYSLYVVNGGILTSINQTASVLDAISKQGGVYMFACYCPIWLVILVEFCFAYGLELVMGSPCSFRLASKVFNPRDTYPVMFETAIICATVGLMCPAMSFIAAWLYYPYYLGFNFPFAFFSQLFFIQPLIRTVFKTLFRKTA